MPFNANIPLSTDKLSASQVDLNNNFQAINTWTAVDHIAFANTVQQGEHKRVFFVQQAADIATAGATDAVLYTKAGTGGATNLFYRGPSNVDPVELTYANTASNGYTMLPSGIMMQWGIATINSGAAETVFTFPFGTICLNVQLTAQYVSGQKNVLQVDSFTQTGFKGRSKPLTGGGYEATVVYYLAIGY
jgi:hypothetical protein